MHPRRSVSRIIVDLQACVSNIEAFDGLRDDDDYAHHMSIWDENMSVK